MFMKSGKSVRLFLADGTPGGLLTAEIMNWTGHVAAAPRSGLAALLKREEAKRTGIYMLLGDDPENLGGITAYIGEADDISKRLYQHNRPEEQNGKDFWNRVIILTSKDTNLTKAHARYLESRLIALALQANRAELVNSTNPPAINLPEADLSDMEYFIEQAKIILPVLGVNILRSAKTIMKSSSVDAFDAINTSPTFKLELKKAGIVATAQEVDGEFTVMPGSTARFEWVGVIGHNYARLREKLEQDGTLAISHNQKTREFTHEYVFSSPSAAAAVISGRSANGRTAWFTEDGKMNYGEWQSLNVEAP